MASSGWQGDIANGIAPIVEGHLAVDVWRHNNTLHFSNARVGLRNTNGWDRYQWWSAIRVHGHDVWNGVVKGNGTQANRLQEFWGGGASGQIGIGPDTQNVWVEGLFSRAVQGPTNRSFGFNAWVPPAGYPQGIRVSFSEVGEKTAKFTASVDHWGDHCDAGNGIRIEYKAVSDSAWTNLPFTRNNVDTRFINNLRPETEYELRAYVQNGAGRGGNSSTIRFKTKPDARAIMIYPDGRKYKCKVKIIFPDGRKYMLNRWKKVQ